MDNIWKAQGNDYSPGSTANNTQTIPPGVFEYRSHPARGWWLAKTTDKFVFPYKIYGVQDHITTRVARAWGALDNNLGIMLNGLKGTGKSVAAKMIANWGIDKGYAVLNVRGPVPLATIFEQVEQPLIVIFDEFEKTHDKEAQQALLTTLDGMSRSDFRRLFIFTSNSKAVDPNLIDRPSRIRYCWEFDNMTQELIEEVVDDMLDPKLVQFRPSILAYLETRKVLSIDVVKTTVAEVNIFQEDASTFDGMLNLTQKQAKGFTICTIEDDKEKIVFYNFSAQKRTLVQLQTFIGRSRESAWDAHIDYQGHATWSCANRGFPSGSINLRRPAEAEDPQLWIAELQLPYEKTWVDNYPHTSKLLRGQTTWICTHDEDWVVPQCILDYEASEGKNADLIKDIQDWAYSYEDDNPHKEFVVRIEPNYDETTSRGPRPA